MTLPLWDAESVAASQETPVPASPDDTTGGKGVLRVPTRNQPRTDGPEHWLALELARRVAAWSSARGAPPDAQALAMRAAYEVGLGLALGHSCIDSAALIPPDADAARLRDALLASRIVTGAHGTDPALPLMLDDDGRLYLHRYFDYERRLAERLCRSREHVLDRGTEERLASRLDELFAANAKAGIAVDWQKIAVALALRNGVTVISGGPGTGKTTTIVNLLACLLELEPDCRIALAAPTGKAAARMQETVRQRAAHLPDAVRARLPVESFTIHRLLGVKSDGASFVHDAANPVPFDVVIVDEASMLDLALAAKLFEAVAESARIVLLGDKDQLAAVESGAVFSELSGGSALSETCIAALARMLGIRVEALAAEVGRTPPPLRDSVVWFTHKYRFGGDSGIARIAQSIKAGAAQETIDCLRHGADAGMAWLEDGGAILDESSRARLLDGYKSYVAALQSDAQDRSAIFAAFDRFRILCAQRDGARGVAALNEAMTRRCRDAIAEAWPSTPRSAWHVGRPVMVLHNDYVLKLYNGDIGIALPDDDGRLLVYFRGAEGALRAIAPTRLPGHEAAFATTVHKAQGSEFDAVALVLPTAGSRVLTRELVYTAVTRARSGLTLVCGVDALEQAIGSPTVRHSGLVARMARRGAADATSAPSAKS